MSRSWLLTLGCLASLGIPCRGAEPAAPVPIPRGLDLLNRLRDALKTGTPAEKEAALDMIRDLKPIRLVPELIAAVGDPTSLPDHTTPDCKTGWSFVGHQAATVMAEIARDIDGVHVGNRPGERPVRAYSFSNDLDQGPKMEAAGRLAEVRGNWAKWWDAARK